MKHKFCPDCGNGMSDEVRINSGYGITQVCEACKLRIERVFPDDHERDGREEETWIRAEQEGPPAPADCPGCKRGRMRPKNGNFLECDTCRYRKFRFPFQRKRGDLCGTKFEKKSK